MSRAFVVLADIALMVLAAVLAALLRDNFETGLEKLAQLQPYLLATALVAFVTIHALAIDRVLWRYSAMRDYIRVFLAIVVVVAAATVLTFVGSRMDGVARSIPFLHILTASFLLIGARVISRLLLLHGQSVANGAQGLGVRSEGYALVVGLSSLSELLIKAAEEFRPHGLKVGAILEPGRPSGNIYGVPLLGHSIGAAVDELATHGVYIARIIVAVDEKRLPDALRYELERLRAEAKLPVSGLLDLMGCEGAAPAPTRIEHENISIARASPAIFDVPTDLVAAVAGRPFWHAKRLIDGIVAASMLLLLSPVFAVIALVLMCSIGRPAIFWQLRPGQYGHQFKLYKFRTMVSARDATGRLLEDEERQNRLGRFLRATRLDELPQLVNILKGDMSFVGPRPLLPHDQSAAHAGRLLVKPGLTGWAQVHGGRAVDASDKAALDLWYVKHASFTTDIRIIFYTVPMIIFGEKVSRSAINAAWQDLQPDQSTD